jgi:hypothetical protein
MIFFMGELQTFSNPVAIFPNRGGKAAHPSLLTGNGHEMVTGPESPARIWALDFARPLAQAIRA